MHRALSVPEVIEAIVDAIPSDDKALFYSLALTNRSFSNVALYHLWSHPHTPLYFLGLIMPEESRKVCQVFDESRHNSWIIVRKFCLDGIYHN
jgi:hypothetical protein